MFERSGDDADVTGKGVNEQRRQRCQDLLCDRRGYATPRRRPFLYVEGRRSD